MNKWKRFNLGRWVLIFSITHDPEDVALLGGHLSVWRRVVSASFALARWEIQVSIGRAL